MQAFCSLVWSQGAEHARDDLPWRYCDDPYAVWVSEAMLQQTQVPRVLDYWPRWMSRYPSIDALSSASTSDVLELWQGLGYNRRALALKKAADICALEHVGRLPSSIDDLVKLPGIGPATAAGIVAFAYQKPCVYLETNVRTVFLHHFFADADKVPDAHIVPLVRDTCSTSDPRGWYYCLLDYGHHLKKTNANPSRRSASYTRQSRFEGSRRQKRSFVVREVLASPGIYGDAVLHLLNQHERQAGRDSVAADDFAGMLQELASEGFFSIQDGRLVP